jgi:hypothetical protein
MSLGGCFGAHRHKLAAGAAVKRRRRRFVTLIDNRGKQVDNES